MRPARARRLASVLAGLEVLVVGCRASGSFARARAGDGPAVPDRAAPVHYADVTVESGIRFTNEHGSALPLTIVETTGGGVCLLDYDGDGWLDVYLVSEAGDNRLFRNRHDGTFTDVSTQAGVTDHGRYHMGCCAADFDNDGRTDLYLTNYGRNTLLRNRGDGTFEDVTEHAGVGDPHWSIGCAFLDYDRDGLLDLYVANYLDFASGPRLCSYHGVESNCRPFAYRPQPHTLYRNRGDGTFEDVSRAAGITARSGRGMGVVSFDFNDDGLPDIAVANDGDGNFLFRNRGDGTFREVGLRVGVAYNRDGHATSSMGIDFADYDLDGAFDLVVTTFQQEAYGLYHNLGGGLFGEEGERTGVAAATRPYVGWGGGFVDFDNDGDKDLFFANGHVHHNIAEIDPGSSFAQPAQLLENRDGVFVVSPALAGLHGPAVGRGVAFGDLDNDGDVDIVVNNLGQSAALLRNEGGNRNHWLTIELHGRRGLGPGQEGTNRSAVGTRVIVTAGGKPQMDEVRAGGGYASSNDPRLHFGLGQATQADVRIRWPRSPERLYPGVSADRFMIVSEGGKVEFRR